MEIVVSEEIVTYKGFNADWTCSGFKFEIGAEYTHEGEVKACESGFHACEYPLDVFNYYAPANSKFAVVKQSGNLSKHGGDSRVASEKILITAEIGIAGLIKAAVDYTFSRCTAIDNQSPASSTGYYGAASSTGKSGIAVASGVHGKAMASKGSAIVLCAYDDEGNMTHVKSAIAGRGKIKADTWYTLNEKGSFVQVE